MLNKVVLMGRLTADPQLRHTQTNLPVTTFSLAVNRSYAKKDAPREADFFDIVCWRNTAEFVSKYFAKGMQVVVSGSLQTRTWKDQQTGANRKTVEVIADEVFFAEGKRDGAGRSEDASASSSPAPAFESDQTDAFLELSDNDALPF